MDLLWLALLCAFLGLLGLFPLAWFGRRWLDSDPTPENACRAAKRVHLLVTPLLVIAVGGAVSAGRMDPTWRIPLPVEIGMVLTLLALTFFFIATITLVVRGLGSPILIVFTRRLAFSGLYARTRNPIILGGLLLLVSLGLWLQSLFLVFWSTGLFLPVIVFFLKTYEERELEIRFGDEYRSYRSRTPMVFPRF